MANSRLYNSATYFIDTRVEDSGFREYDARWVIEPRDNTEEDVQINYRGLTQLGNWLGRFLQLSEYGSHEEIVLGHDFRKYSENAKNALVLGLLSSGLDVHDLGLSLTPAVYYAQHRRKIRACAMVTASHNPNGWTGVKMGNDYSKTFGPKEMTAFLDFTRQEGMGLRTGAKTGRYLQHADGMTDYVDYVRREWQPRFADLPRFSVAVETGNGTGGLVLPDLLGEFGFQVECGHVVPDWDFPNFNPNPESVPFLLSVRDLVTRSGAEIGLCIDGDGDRLGVVDQEGGIVFSDRVGLVVARALEAKQEDCSFVVDVKSTSLFSSQLKSRVVWEKTGHSYIKARVAQEGATAGFERSGHFFLTPPYGLGYDDANVGALMLLWIVCEAKAGGGGLAELLAELPISHQSPNRQPKVAEEQKYEIMEAIGQKAQRVLAADPGFFGASVKETITINGMRLEFEDGSWLLIRASSNTPNLVILAESFDADGTRLKEIDAAVRNLLGDIEGIGEFEPLHRV